MAHKDGPFRVGDLVLAQPFAVGSTLLMDADGVLVKITHVEHGTRQPIYAGETTQHRVYISENDILRRATTADVHFESFRLQKWLNEISQLAFAQKLERGDVDEVYRKTWGKGE